FIVNCTDYEDEEYHQDLFYRLYQRVTLPNGEHVYTIVAYGSSSTIGPVRLSPSMENGTFTRQVELKVEIMNVARSITLVPISFKFQSLTDEINFRKFVRNLDKFEIKNQEDLRTVKDIATILNLVTDVPYDARIEARNKLLHIITDVRIKNFETLELVSYILMSLSDKENEMQEDGLNNGVNVIGKLTKMLTDFAEQNIETAEHIA
ncbi:polycystic kidney disease protein 1-like 2, partial [Biomphalaria glabrata]